MSQVTKKKKDSLQTRPPVVVVLGHVDHGKSSLLEAIRDFKITAKESGGITQHIGAYEIEEGGKKITFIDTPGHEAFSAMRARGARIADIAILVVAGEEGVKPQTKEAILHIKKAEIPMIVAINKIDKTEADPEKVKRELLAKDIIVESMGGNIPCVEVSAKTKKGIPEFLEMILLVAEMENLKADISKKAEGAVIESYLDAKRGPTATLILKEGILKKGDVIGTVSVFGKIKSLENFQGRSLNEALSSMPVVVMGFEKVPGVGEKFEVFSDIETAQKNLKNKERVSRQVLDIEEGIKVLNIILKADVVGSLEAIEEVLKDIPQEKAVLRILKAEVGEINESDVKLAKSAKASVVGFRVKANRATEGFARREKITIMAFEIIYELAQAVRLALEKRVESKEEKIDLGKVKILAVFLTEKNRQIIGGKVVEGKVRKGVSLEVFRNGEKVGAGKIINLQRNKKEIGEIEKGSECGMLYDGNVKIEEGDIVQAYVIERRKREL